MENIFKILYEEINDINSLEDSLEKHFLTIQDFFNAPYQEQSNHKEDVERLILLKNNVISKYAFQTLESRSFILILLDFCERFAIHSCIPRIMKIIQKNGITVNKRMTAALKYLFPAPSSNDDLLSKYDEIFELLNEAVTEEEDNPSKSLVTFLNYYAHIILNTNVDYSIIAKQKLCDKIDTNQYSWLTQIEDISALDVCNPTLVYKTIEDKIDLIANKQDKTKAKQEETLLLEEGTDYCEELSHTPNRFLSIRQISVNNSKEFIKRFSSDNAGGIVFFYMTRLLSRHFYA